MKWAQKMANTEWIHLFFLIVAIFLEILANVFIKMSKGFTKKVYGFASIVSILAAFSALAQAVKGIDLSIAYAAWGGVGMLVTMLLGQIRFKQKIKLYGWAGSLLIVGGIFILKSA